MNRFSTVVALALFTLPLASSASAAMTLYSGEMELVTVSGSGCTGKDKAGSRIRVDLALEQGGSSSARSFTGYFNGPDIERGRFSGGDLGHLQVFYPDKPNRSQGDSLVLSTTAGGLDGELSEKPQPDSTSCYFEKAVLKLEQVATGSKAESDYARQRDLFDAEAYLISGQSLLQADKPGEAIPELTKSLNLRDRVNPNDPDKALPAVPIAIAHLMSGREADALAVLGGLFGSKSDSGDDIVKRRMAASASLCNEEQYLESDAGQKASLRLMDVVASKFGSLDGVAVPLAACYLEIAKEYIDQDDPESAVESFQKSLKLKPDNPDSITGVVMCFLDMESPAEGRKFLREHAATFIKNAGKVPYDTLMAYVYAAESQQEEKNGDLVRAEELSREAIKSRPGERTLIIALTRVLAKEGKSTEARKLLEDSRGACGDEVCRQDYANELGRQEIIERMVKRLEKP